MAIVKIPDLTTGWYPDQLPENLVQGSFSSVINMRCTAGRFERYRGMTNVFGTPGAIPYWITPYTSNTTRYWVTGCLNKIYAYDGSSQIDITPTPAPSGAIDNRYTGGMFNGVLVINNSVDIPWVWGGSGVAVALPNWDSTWRAKSIRPFKNYLVAIGVAKGANLYPHMVKWSGPAVPGAVPSSWNEADPASDAGELDLAETADLMVDMLPLGDVMIIYKERSMYSMQFVGGQSIFDFKRIPGESGLLGRGCVVDTPIGHIFLTPGDVKVHQGQQPVSIADGVVREFIFNNMNSILATRSFLVANPQKSEVLVCFPSTDSEVCNMCASYNWVTKKWGMRTMVNATYAATGQINPNSTILQWDADNDAWDTDASTWNENEYAANEARVLFSRAGGATGNITAFDVGTTDYGVQIASSAERIGDDFGDQTAVKCIKTIYPKIDASNGTLINFTIGGSMNAADAITWGTPVQFTVGSSNKVDMLASGGYSWRYMAYRIEGADFNYWAVREMAFDIDSRGYF